LPLSTNTLYFSLCTADPEPKFITGCPDLSQSDYTVQFPVFLSVLCFNARFSRWTWVGWFYWS